MSELIERTSDNMHNHPFNPRPIPETTALFWAQIAEEQFQQIMPDLGIPFSPVYTATASSYSRIRRKIIKRIGYSHTEEPPDSIMEYIHGEIGNAILIRRELVADLPVHDDFELRVYFEHFFWQELGHFYAINIRELLKSVDFQGADSIDVHELEAHIFENALNGKQYPVKPSETDTFFDAVVVSEGKLLATDAITSHRDNKELLELAVPNPITMIRIRPDVRFKFQFSLREAMGVAVGQKIEMCKTILKDLGIDAKTNVGYVLLVEPEQSVRFEAMTQGNTPGTQT